LWSGSDVLLPRLALEDIDGVRADEDQVRVSARTRDGSSALCPRCATASVREPSRYTRHVTDEAVGGRPLVIDLSERRLYCRTIECPQVTFAEQLEGLTARYKTQIWERTRHLLRLLHALREFFPAALVAFDDLAAADTLELLAAAPGPASAAALSVEQITGALAHARRHNRAARPRRSPPRCAPSTWDNRPWLPPLTLPPSAPRSRSSPFSTARSTRWRGRRRVEAYFGQHPDAEVYLSQPGLGVVLGARVLAEFGDDKDRYADAKARKNYAGTSPITRQSGRKKLVMARHVHNDRLLDALGRQAFCALRASPGARACYDQIRARGISHHAA
jgi:hypothetical protein